MHLISWLRASMAPSVPPPRSLDVVILPVSEPAMRPMGTGRQLPTYALSQLGIER